MTTTRAMCGKCWVAYSQMEADSCPTCGYVPERAGPAAEPAESAAGIIQAALGHMQDRAATYDKPQGERSMGKTAAMFSTLYAEQLAAGEFSEEMGWAFMVLLKLVRTSQGGYRADNYEDGVAYFGLMGEAAAGRPSRNPATELEHTE